MSDEQGSEIGTCADAWYVQGNILIGEEGIARLGDFGITVIIADPTVWEPRCATGSRSRGLVRYMAPELLNPSQFNLENGNPSKESDVYSFAMTVFEVRLPHTAHGYRYH